MKIIRFLFAILALFATLLAIMGTAPADAASLKKLTIIALPNDYGGPLEDVERGLNRIAFASERNTGTIFVNAASQAVIAEVVVPDEDRFLNLNVRLRYLAPAFAKAARFLKQAATTPAQYGLPSRIDIPTTANEISKTLRIDADETEIVFLGSARFYDPRQPSFSMKDGAVFSDSMIAASDMSNPFGASNRKGFLARAYIHMCIAEASAGWPTPQTKAATERAWSLFFSEQGASLSTFSPDVASCMDRAIRGNLEPITKYRLNKDDHSGAMVSFVPETARVESKSVKAAPVAPAQLPVSKVKPQAAEEPAARVKTADAPATTKGASPAVPDPPRPTPAGRTAEASSPRAPDAARPHVTENNLPTGTAAKPCAPAKPVTLKRRPAKPKRTWSIWAQEFPIDADGLYATNGDPDYDGDAGDYPSIFSGSPRYEIERSARSTVSPSITRRAEKVALSEHAGDPKRRAARCR